MDRLHRLDLKVRDSSSYQSPNRSPMNVMRSESVSRSASPKLGFAHLNNMTHQRGIKNIGMNNRAPLLSNIPPESHHGTSKRAPIPIPWNGCGNRLHPAEPSSLSVDHSFSRRHVLCDILSISIRCACTFSGTSPLLLPSDVFVETVIASSTPASIWGERGVQIEWDKV